MLLLLSWCLMSSDVIWHIRDKLWPMPKHGSIRKVYACLAVTCHLHFWQNDRDFLRATVVTRGWNGYRNKSQHRKSSLEKIILPPFQQGFEPATFQSRVRRSNHWAIPAPSSFWRQQNVFKVTDRTLGSSQFCVQITEEMHVEFNRIFISVERTFDGVLKYISPRENVSLRSILTHNDWQCLGKISRQVNNNNNNNKKCTDNSWLNNINLSPPSTPPIKFKKSLFSPNLRS